MLTTKQKLDFTLSQGNKLCFNKDMDKLMREYRELIRNGLETKDKLNEIETKVESILLGNG